MTKLPQTLPEIRKTYLDAFNQAENETQLLRDMLDALTKAQSELFVHDGASAPEDISQDKTFWDHTYFSKQKKQAEMNFSRLRVEHLLEVRDFFRKRRDKGFAPPPRVVIQPTNTQAQVPGYTPSSHLKKFVEEGHLSTIRGALRGDLIDRRLSSDVIRQSLIWVKARVPNLYEPYQEKAFSRGIDTDRNQWNQDYFFTQEEYLEAIFSEERLLHMVNVREHLRQQGVEGFAAIPIQASKTPHNTSPTPSETAPSPSANTSKPVMHPQRPFTLSVALGIGGAIAALATLLFLWMQ